MRSFSVALSFASVLSLGLGALVPTETFHHSATLLPDDGYQLYWKYDDTSITFEVHVQTKGWVGFGISPNGGMTRSDVVIAWVDGNGDVRFDDRFAIEEALPEVDESQDWKLLYGAENVTHTIIKFSRKLNTCDRQDLEITDATVRVIWSFGTADPVDNKPLYHHGNRGAKSIQILSPAVETSLPDDVITLNILNPNVSVPNFDTTYWCQVFVMPNLTSKHHVVKVEPVVQPGHEWLVHHILMYACDESMDSRYEGYGGICLDPNMPGDIRACSTFMFAWGIGGGPIVFPDHVGYPIGGEHSPRYVRLEMHYDNPSLTAGLFDSSGLRLTYTPTVRENDAGIIYAGMMVTPWHLVPPKFPSLSSYGHCVKECLEQSMGEVDKLQIIGTALHTHLLGTAVSVRHLRDGQELHPIATDNYYDFNFQETRMLKEEITLKKGDAISVQCKYDSQERPSFTKGGLKTSDEMCLAFVYYYPAIKISVCSSVPLPSQTLTYINAQTSYVGRQVRVSSGPHSGKTMFQVVEESDWTSKDTRDAFQKAITGGQVLAFCQVSKKVHYQINNKPVQIPEITIPFVPPEVCPSPIDSATGRSLPLVAMLTTLLASIL